MIYEDPESAYLHFPDRISAAELAARYPEAAVLFDEQCPHMAQAADLVFRVDVSPWDSPRRDRLVAMAGADARYQRLLEATSVRRRDAIKKAARDGEEPPPPPRYSMVCTWTPIAPLGGPIHPLAATGFWRRRSFSISSRPRRKQPRAWPIKSLALDDEPGATTLYVAQRGTFIMNIEGAIEPKPGMRVVSSDGGKTVRVAITNDGAGGGGGGIHVGWIRGLGETPGTVLVELGF